MTATLEKLTGIVGKENFSTDPEALEAYAYDQSYALPIKPWAIVKPKNVDDVQAIVNWANETQTPLVPVSSGPPHFHGDTVPSAPGAVMVDMSGWKKIIKIDPRNRIAYIEAGVTYSELQAELTKQGLRITPPLMPRANKSIIASLLEREPTLISRLQWNALDPLRCTEVIFGDGQKLITGDAGNWPSLEKGWSNLQSASGAAGPGQLDFYRIISAAQGSMGIVTWASVRVDTLPEPHKMFFVPGNKLEDLIDFTYRVLRFRYGDEVFIVNNLTLASMLGTEPDEIKALKDELPPWAVIIGIGGRALLQEEKVAYMEKDIGEIAQGFALELLPAVPGAKGLDLRDAIYGEPKEHYWKLGYKGAYRDIFFMTTVDKTPGFLKVMQQTAEDNNYPATDIGVYIQPVHQGASCHCEFILPFNEANPKEAARMKELFNQASEAMLNAGAFYSRPYGIWAGLAYNRDAQTTTVLRKLKGVFDPNNVMNPGKLCF